MNYFAIVTTCGGEEEASRIAEELLNRKLVACANWWAVSSAYWWEGDCEHAEEFMLFMKTTEERLSAVESTIRSIHSYQNPEVIFLGIAGGSEAYLDWIRGSVR